ncbi:calcium-binding protein [Thalassococcus sp. S3]|uniref:calcium-binding protein n=1 Tax=Thalassococcus sp. S3 TaxID=2017482 RepID=UPI001024252F|nr:calcium-binding protein [Thalassococcus sp. S3]QBF34277.1 hypothetical protein CFI11_24130 [Thalassococcus sp. S3]
MQIDYFGPTDDYFTQAFFNPLTREFDVETQGNTATRIDLFNVFSGFKTTITGSGFPADLEGTLSGTITSIMTTTFNNRPVATLSNLNWNLNAFVAAMDELAENDNGDPLTALVNGSGPITVNATQAADGFTEIFDGVGVPVTFNGSANGDNTEGGSANDLLTGNNGDDTLVGNAGNDTLLGGNGRDELRGGDGNDSINPGTSTSNELIATGRGQDTVNFSSVQDGFIELDYSTLGGGIQVTLNSPANTGQVNKGGNGSDTMINVANALSSAIDGGMRIGGTNASDVFNVTLKDGDWLSLIGGIGNDRFNLQGEAGFVRLSFRIGADGNAPLTGVVLNLATGIVSNDGFQGTDTITGAVDEIRATNLNDSIIGSAGNERFILQAGTDTLEAGQGFDVLRYDRDPVISVNVDHQAGTATGSWGNSSFNHSFSGVERINGSRTGDDTMLASDMGSVFYGRGGNDSLTGRGGNDLFYGEDGNDTLTGNNGNDTLFGGNGQDALFGNAGNDNLFGEDGNDLIRGGFGNDRAGGGTGDDTLYGWAGFDTLFGGAGNDVLWGEGEGDQLFGEIGNDTIYAGGGNDLIGGGVGEDLIFGGTGTDRAFGGAGNDEMFGGNDNDRLFGEGGNDLVQGQQGNDLLGGGDGNDTVLGGFGNDTLFGGNQNDRLSAWDGADQLFGGAGNDTLLGEGGNDVLFGEGGADQVFGGAGNDTLGGGAENDIIGGGSGADRGLGGTGNDQIFGADGNDTLFGEGGNDTVLGQQGDDVIGGGAGNDRLHGGFGNDQMFGGAGADLFIFNATDGADVIGDFQNDIDTIQLSSMAYTLSVTAAGARLDFGGGNSLLVQGTFASVAEAEAVLNDDLIFV